MTPGVAGIPNVTQAGAGIDQKCKHPRLSHVGAAAATDWRKTGATDNQRAQSWFTCLRAKKLQNRQWER